MLGDCVPVADGVRLCVILWVCVSLGVLLCVCVTLGDSLCD